MNTQKASCWKGSFLSFFLYTVLMKVSKTLQVLVKLSSRGLKSMESGKKNMTAWNTEHSWVEVLVVALWLMWLSSWLKLKLAAFKCFIHITGPLFTEETCFLWSQSGFSLGFFFSSTWTSCYLPSPAAANRRRPPESTLSWCWWPSQVRCEGAKPAKSEKC